MVSLAGSESSATAGARPRPPARGTASAKLAGSAASHGAIDKLTLPLAVASAAVTAASARAPQLEPDSVSASGTASVLTPTPTRSQRRRRTRTQRLRVGLRVGSGSWADSTGTCGDGGGPGSAHSDPAATGTAAKLPVAVAGSLAGFRLGLRLRGSSSRNLNAPPSGPGGVHCQCQSRWLSLCMRSVALALSLRRCQ